MRRIAAPHRPPDAGSRRKARTRCWTPWASIRWASMRWSRAPASRAELQARLLELELAGEVARLPGGLFQRIGQRG